MAGKVLAIDPGLLCGWALRQGNDIIGSGTWNLRGDKWEGAGMRWIRMRGYLLELHATHGIGIVVYEAVRRHQGTDAAHVYGSIVGVIQEFCESEGIPYRGLDVGKIKKHATGKGNASKEQMLAAARVRWGERVIDHNVADALWIADLAMSDSGIVRHGRPVITWEMGRNMPCPFSGPEPDL